MSCPSCDIPGRIGFCLPLSHGFEGVGSNQVGFGLQGGGSDDKPLVRMFLVEDCSGPETAPDTY